MNISHQYIKRNNQKLNKKLEAKEHDRQDKILDKKLKDTFPASDSTASY